MKLMNEVLATSTFQLEDFSFQLKGKLSLWTFFTCYILVQDDKASDMHILVYHNRTDSYPRFSLQPVC